MLALELISKADIPSNQRFSILSAVAKSVALDERTKIAVGSITEGNVYLNHVSYNPVAAMLRKCDLTSGGQKVNGNHAVSSKKGKIMRAGYN